MAPASSPATRAESQASDCSTGISRRDFGLRAAVAALSFTPLPVLATEAKAESPDTEHVARREDVAQQSKDGSARGASASPEVEAKLSNIVRKYGSRLSQEQREHLRRILTYNEKMLASVRAFALQNGDSPASVLRISFAGESGQQRETAISSATEQPRLAARPQNEETERC